ncbi:peptidase MA family metallohydrolase [Planococcus shixiaomingii]|uniref:peptidase MA family metallohydrolase n=1 Tax=Planococcus shixiaomingii TaxID=3058393 RepID=UPI0026135F86|nr:collagenase [Planococcus sp. N022]WKA54565.1 collagenase [Planococcus sp. N022]
MKTSTKMLPIILSSIIVLLGIVLVGGSIFLSKFLEEKTQEELTYFQSIQMLFNTNFDGAAEREIKEANLREDHHHVSIYYEENFTDLLPLTKDTLDWAIERNEELFGELDERKMDLIVFENPEDITQLSDLKNISGFYSEFERLLGIIYYNKESILEGNELALYRFQKNILHEYTHYAFERKIDKTKADDSTLYPVWFHEGLAEYVGNDKIRIEHSYFKDVPLQQLTTHDQWQKARFINKANVYEQSYFAIKYLVDQYGEESINELVESIGETRDFEKSFTELTGMTVTEFEQELNSYYME